MQLGLSESARVTTAEEARFRIAYPNSRPRTSRVIALDEASFELLRRLQDHEWNNAHFLRFIATRPMTEPFQMLSMDAELEDLTGRRVGMIEEIGEADVTVMVISAGAPADAAEAIGNACFVRNRLTTGLVLAPEGTDKAGLTLTLKAMRPFAAMLVVSSGAEYIDAMLSALRA